jgi:laccase
MDMNNAMDGVPGVSQCTSPRNANAGPIPPGGSFTYRFRATSYGNTWYHSHFSLQYPDGIVGPIIIYGPSSANWDIDLGALPINDWFHEPASELFFVEELPGLPIPADTGLINGKNTFNGSGEYYNMTFTPGKKHRIRLVNTSTNTHFKFWIDQHTMTVQAADFVPITPYNTTVLNIAIGIPPGNLIKVNDTISS